MKTWLKGGIIGAILIIVLYVCAILIPGMFFKKIFSFMMIATILPMIQGGTFQIIIYFSLIILEYFILGAIIGYIYGKIKNRNQIIQN